MAFVFPFALATEAVSEMEAVSARLRAVVRMHDDALAGAHVDFEGATRQQFDADLADALDGLRSHAETLDRDADDLRDTIAVAQWLASLDQDDP